MQYWTRLRFDICVIMCCTAILLCLVLFFFCVLFFPVLSCFLFCPVVFLLCPFMSFKVLSYPVLSSPPNHDSICGFLPKQPFRRDPRARPVGPCGVRSGLGYQGEIRCCVSIQFLKQFLMILFAFLTNLSKLVGPSFIGSSRDFTDFVQTRESDWSSCSSSK